MKPGLILALILLALVTTVSGAQAQGLPLFTIDRNLPELHTIDPLTGEILTSVTITLGGLTVEGGNGLALHPQTGQFFALLKIAGQTGRELVTLNTSTGAATSIGNTGDNLAAIAFDDTGTLWGVTGDGATTPATLFTINTTDAIPTLRLALGTNNVCCGESLAFNPDDGLLYHASGEPINVLETIDPVSLTRTPLTLNGPDFSSDPQTLAHWRGNFFLLVSFGMSFLVQRTGGSVTIRNIGSLPVGHPFDHQPKGAVFAGAAPPCPPLAQLYGAGYQAFGPTLFYSLNPQNGTPTLIGPIGFENVSAMDFSPDGILFAAGERMDGSDFQVLLTIDPCTGVGTEVGALNLPGVGEMRDISFRNSDGVLFGNFRDAFSSTGHVVTIDTATGASTDVGGDPASFGPGGGMTFSSNDTLFLTTVDFLFTVDQTTGMVLSQGMLSFPPPADIAPTINAMDVDTTGTVFGSIQNSSGLPGDNYLSTVNTTSGEVTLRGSTQKGLDAIAFVSGVADLFLSKADSPDPVSAMNNLTYTLTVANAGPEAATNVVLTDTLPTEVNFSSAVPSQGTCAHDMGVVTCMLGTINALANVSVTLTVVPQMLGTITNTASVTLDEPDPDTANNTASAATSVVDFEMTVMPPSVTVNRGSSATYTVTVTPLGGRFDNPVVLSCMNLPAGSACTFVPASVIPGGSPINSTLTISTTAPASVLPLPQAPPPPALPYTIWLALLLALLLGLLAPSYALVASEGKRRLPAFVALLLLLFVLSLQVACGGGGGDEAMPVAPPASTPTGTHTITVRGTFGSLQHDVMVNLVVQ